MMLITIIPGASYCQDLLVKKDGSELLVKVSEIGTSTTKYQINSIKDGAVIEVMNTELFMIKFENGEKHVFKNKADNGLENDILGKQMYGGYVFYTTDNGKHGLVAAPSDIHGLVKWGRAQRRLGASSFSDGRRNTELIDSEYGPGFAAGKCAALTADGFDDWYLPAIDELERLFRGRHHVPGLDAIGSSRSRYDYVSSTEYNNRNDCWAIHFSRHGKHFYYNKRNDYSVRCIRKF